MNKRTALAIFALALLTGCIAATRANMGALGSDHKVTLYSGGQVVGSWHSNGIVYNENKSDGFYFEEKQTHKLIEVTGTVVIEQEHP